MSYKRQQISSLSPLQPKKRGKCDHELHCSDHKISRGERDQLRVEKNNLRDEIDILQVENEFMRNELQSNGLSSDPRTIAAQTDKQSKELSTVKREKDTEIDRVKKKLSAVRRERDTEIDRVKKELSAVRREKDTEIDRVKRELFAVHTEKDTEIDQGKKELSAVRREKDSEIDRLKNDISTLRTKLYNQINQSQFFLSQSQNEALEWKTKFEDVHTSEIAFQDLKFQLKFISEKRNELCTRYNILKEASSAVLGDLSGKLDFAIQDMSMRSGLPPSASTTRATNTENITLGEGGEIYGDIYSLPLDEAISGEWNGSDRARYLDTKLSQECSEKPFICYLYLILDFLKKCPRTSLDSRLVISFQQACSRIARIIASLWSEGGKVVILQFEHNSSLEEVQSREASLISAIGKQNLANVLCGTYKGSCREWSFMERAGMGVIILQRVNRSIRNDPTLIKAFSSSVTISTCTFGARFHLKKRRTAPSK